MFMDYGGKESESQSILILPMPPKKHWRRGKKDYRTAFGITARVKTQGFAFTCWHSAAPLSLAQQHPGAAHRDVVWSPPAAFPARPGRPGAVPVCGAAVPSAASAAAPGCTEHRTQINVLPVSLGEAWRQHRGNLAGKNTWKIQYTEN